MPNGCLKLLSIYIPFILIKLTTRAFVYFVFVECIFVNSSVVYVLHFLSCLLFTGSVPVQVHGAVPSSSLSGICTACAGTAGHAAGALPARYVFCGQKLSG